MFGQRLVHRSRKGLALLTTLALASAPAVAMAAETAAVEDPKVKVAKYVSAALAMGLSALGAAYAQAKIGSAAAATLAENPDAGTMLIVLQALPEIIVLLGFVSALIITG